MIADLGGDIERTRASIIQLQDALQTTTLTAEERAALEARLTANINLLTALINHIPGTI